ARSAEGSPWENQEEEFGAGQFRPGARFPGTEMGLRRFWGERTFPGLRGRNGWWNQPAFQNRFGAQGYGRFPGRNFAARSAEGSQWEDEDQDEPGKKRQPREQVKEGHPGSKLTKQKRRKRTPSAHDQDRRA